MINALLAVYVLTIVQMKCFTLITSLYSVLIIFDLQKSVDATFLVLNVLFENLLFSWLLLYSLSAELVVETTNVF